MIQLMHRLEILSDVGYNGWPPKNYSPFGTHPERADESFSRFSLNLEDSDHIENKILALVEQDYGTADENTFSTFW
jgi:hypothetical protein